MTTLKKLRLQPTKAPNLPIAPVAYSQQYGDQLSNAFRLYFAQIDNITQALTIPDSGITADRPTDRLQVGQFYFDTTLGLPIWWDGSDWIDASGTVV